MELTRCLQPSIRQLEHASPGDAGPLATAAQCAPPGAKNPFPEHSEAVEVSRYRVVVEVALYET